MLKWVHLTLQTPLFSKPLTMRTAGWGGADTCPWPVVGLPAWWTTQRPIAPREWLGSSESMGSSLPVPGQLGRDADLRETKAVTLVLRITAKQRTLII